MEVNDFDILPADLLEDFCQQVNKSLSGNFDKITDSESSVDSFSFYISVSAVFSSKIEGEDIELDSFLKHKMLGVKFLPDHTQKIDDLYESYRFAQHNRLNTSTIGSAHKLLTKNILQPSQRGTVRTVNMFVTTPDGKIEYVACAPVKVKPQLERLYNNVERLLKANLSIEEAFFYASMIHLVFVKIHPFSDGNGRTARLLEKWFLAEKLGPKAWFIQSEKYYYLHHQEYYHNIRLMGLEYELLNYSRAMPFLMMLPESLGI